MHNPGKVAVIFRRDPISVAVIAVGAPAIMPPVFKAEGRIGYDAIEALELVAIGKFGVAQGVAAKDLKIFHAVQKQVHARDGLGGEVFLLAFERQKPGVFAALLDVVDGFKQHAASAASRVIDDFTDLRIEDIHHQADDAARGIKFTGFFIGFVGELLDEKFISAAHVIIADILHAHWNPVEVIE